MKNLFSKLSLKQKLALIAILLGIIALFAGNPFDNEEVKVNVKDLALSTVKDADKIKPETLADWIIQGKADYVLIDLRNPEEFEKYSLPEAENIPLATLPDAELYRNQKLILYADDNLRAAQGWFILKSKGFKSVYILDGGLEGWKNDVLFPKLSSNPTKDELQNFEKKKAIAKYFGGAAVTASGSVETKSELSLPTITSSTKSSSTVGSQPKKKKREGC
jgi:rhodanese-related sulfurtransferase